MDTDHTTETCFFRLLYVGDILVDIDAWGIDPRLVHCRVFIKIGLQRNCRKLAMRTSLEYVMSKCTKDQARTDHLVWGK